MKNFKLTIVLWITLVLAFIAAGCSPTADTAAQNKQQPVTQQKIVVPSQDNSGSDLAAKPALSAAQIQQTKDPQNKVTEIPPKEIPTVPNVYPNIPIDHIVIVIEENHSYNQIVGSKNAPYMNELIQKGALLTNSSGVAHPSQPNYLALFSGSTQGVVDDSCGKLFSTTNLAYELTKKNFTFTGYSEDMPKAGFTGCSSNGYARKHNPWVQFNNVPSQMNQPFSVFPHDFNMLPKVSFVVPNHQNDMHDGTVYQADTWLKDHIDPYVKWAAANRSLLIITWDEDNNSKANHIPTIFVGPMVKPGSYADKINHYHVLRTIEELYGLPLIGESDKAEPITTIWKS